MGAVWNPIVEARKRYPELASWDDARIFSNLSDPARLPAPVCLIPGRLRLDQKLNRMLMTRLRLPEALKMRPKFGLLISLTTTPSTSSPDRPASPPSAE